MPQRSLSDLQLTDWEHSELRCRGVSSPAVLVQIFETTPSAIERILGADRARWMHGALRQQLSPSERAVSLGQAVVDQPGPRREVTGKRRSN